MEGSVQTASRQRAGTLRFEGPKIWLTISTPGSIGSLQQTQTPGAYRWIHGRSHVLHLPGRRLICAYCPLRVRKPNNARDPKLR